MEQAAESRDGVVTGRGAALSGPCALSFGETAGLRQVTLGNGAVRAEILLDKGANVRQFWHVPTGARTLAETDDWAERLAVFHRNGHCGSSYSDCYEGGWQDVLPARARWDDGAISGCEGVGEAAIVPWEVTWAISTPAAAHIVCRTRLPRCGLDVVKRFGIRRRKAALRVETTIRNTSGRSVSLSWTQHPALGGDLLDDSSRVLLPGGQRRVRRGDHGPRADGNGIGCIDGTPAHWVGADALLPTCSEDEFVTFANVECGDAALLSSARGVGVRLRWDATSFPHAWLWCARRKSLCCVAVEPSTTYLPEMSSRPESEILHLLRPGDRMRAWVELSSFTLRPEPSLFGSGRS